MRFFLQSLKSNYGEGGDNKPDQGYQNLSNCVIFPYPPCECGDLMPNHLKLREKKYNHFNNIIMSKISIDVYAIKI